ncbi:MAG: hypothetical protein NC213_05260 [Acetobacter sp.]|nr:hypothetical protein [Bacteroides sp.]MCM1341134.1 hypothetical protein [Acetobacter sp.]MCM1433532.1 hypothetical protein [Clostridiales bacterium]
MNEIINKNKHLKLNKTSFKLNYKCFLVIALIITLIILEIRNTGSYLDEILGLCSAVYLIAFRSKVERRDLITIITLFSVVVIGILSNILFNINNSIFSICVDIVAETKLLFSFFFIKYFLSKDEKQRIIDILLPFAKLYTIFAFLLSLLSQVVNLGMTDGERYGIKAFTFFFRFSFQYVAVYILVFGILICNTKMKPQQRKLYYIFATISIVLSTKSPAIVFAIIFVALSYYFKKHQKLNFLTIIAGIVMIIVAGQFQINEYLLVDESPRRLFFQYSFKTANTYFPLGSGFSTFASDQAARIYSPLYYQYGFDTIQGMSPNNTAFLSDTFWPMAIGQFGWIGAALYILVYIRLFLTLDDISMNNQKRAFLYGAYMQYMIYAIGSAILSNPAGMIGFMSLALFSIVTEKESKKEKRIHVKL